METIKVNLPRNQENFISGNGEGCFVSISKLAFKKYQKDYDGGTFKGILENDSFYFPSLKAGTKIEFTMRGKKRPVAFLDKLLKNYTPITDEEFEDLLRKVSEEK